MKLQLTGSGFEHFNGQMGVLEFENGLSTTDCSPIDATRLAGIFGADWEDGSPANVSEIYMDCKDSPALIVPDGLTVMVQEEKLQDEPEKELSKTSQATPNLTGDIHSEESLGAIADAKGIAGLRAIADPLGIKGTSIAVLIASILAVTAEGKS